MKRVQLVVAIILLFNTVKAAFITESDVQSAIEEVLKRSSNSDADMVKRGVVNISTLWQEGDGTSTEFIDYCRDNYIVSSSEKELVFSKVSNYFETLFGHYNEIGLELNEGVQLTYGELHGVDKMFGAYSPSAHLTSDLYANKIALYVALNFPAYTLEEKSELGHSWSRLEWGYARLGDMFTSRVPAELKQKYSLVNSKSNIYISDYNIYMGRLLNGDGDTLFPEDMVLLSHWNLRDEIKSNYSGGESGIEKQEMVYHVMKRIITQEIPQLVINSGEYSWNPIDNIVYEDNSSIDFVREPDSRYQQIIDNFNALKSIDDYSPVLDTYIKRKFSGEMEIPIEDVEELFNSFLSAPELKEVGELISKKIGRDLRPYDIWYDGFKSRSSLDENRLNSITQELYPNAKAMESRLPDLLEKLGWSSERADYLASKIAVDPARGSGHAAGASMKGAKAHLRTRIPENGMNYKGYNIAIHEFGHNVEQTISLYDIDHYMLNGVPNTAFTEALAFIFQKRDLKLLDIESSDSEAEAMEALDIFWNTYEIMGVSMVDIKVWQWLYDNPEATASELKEAVLTISKGVWNSYFADVFGQRDETILAIYSHMISYPLYLSAYSFGHIIDFQLEAHLRDKDFSTEIDRIYKIGRLTPQAWMREATGNQLSVDPMVESIRAILK